ncbi:MAG TPA: SDR family NAD(P)-dependent oxidoreductase [Methylotenera sp.]|nr:SDR family NAD(P)-dependent oxidoreductase [Methylotenera sp.]
MAYAAIIIGGSGAIASALRQALLSDDDCQQIWLFSRSQPPAALPAKIRWQTVEYKQSAIQTALADCLPDSVPVQKVFICNGRLHDGELKPEKRLEQFNAEDCQAIMHSNSIVPMLWVQALLTYLKQPEPCQLVAFSARVGSIGDNHLGGWYSYRASKAALNMFLKTAAVEYQRRAPNVSLVAFHPGTTDTPLSKPYNKNVPADKLLPPALVAEKLLTILADLPAVKTLRFIDWQGKSIDW